MNAEGLTKEVFLRRLDGLLENISFQPNPQEQARLYSGLMDYAREFDVEELAEDAMRRLMGEMGVPELWELPDTFEQQVSLVGFPLGSLPDLLKDYLEAVCRFVQVVPEMAVLPLLSVLSLCVQGKAVIQYPGSDHTEPLNLYTLTIAAPGERKSGCFRQFMQPVEDFETRYNETHRREVDAYRTQKAFLEQQHAAAIKGKHADLEKAKRLADELADLVPVHPLKLNVNDVTPEALAWEMLQQGGRIGILDDEGTVFDVLSGVYSGGNVNINLLLKAYDGTSYAISRRTNEDILLPHPLLTMGLMVQPGHFTEALQNKQFAGRGFIHRFLFAFPESRAGGRTLASECIPEALRKRYEELVTRLLQMKAPAAPHVLRCNQEAFVLFEQYFDHLEQSMQAGRHLEGLKEWANKQFARCLKIAGILHLCEHTPTEAVDELTAQRAVVISGWMENHALKALGGELGDSPEVKAAKYILGRIRQSGKEVMTKRELLRMCQSLNATECEEPLAMLEDMKCIKVETVSRPRGGNPKITIKINPLIY